MFLWGSRWVHAGDTRGNHAKGSDGDHRKERSGVGRHMGGVRFKKIMWSHVHVLSSLSLSLSLSLPPLFCGCGPIHLSSSFSLHNLYIYPQLRLRWSNGAFNYTCSLLRVLLLPTLPLQSCFSKPKGVYIHLKTSDLLFGNMYENSCG